MPVAGPIDHMTGLTQALDHVVGRFLVILHHQHTHCVTSKTSIAQPSAQSGHALDRKKEASPGIRLASSMEFGELAMRYLAWGKTTPLIPVLRQQRLPAC